MVCAAVFGMHMVYAPARVWPFPGGLLPSQSQEASMICWVLFQQTNKTNKQAHKKNTLTIRLVKWLGWVFKNKERKKEDRVYQGE